MTWIRGLWTSQWDFKVAMAVPCPEPYCRANATWPCTTKNGHESSTCHASRHRAYWSKQHAEKANQDT